MSSHTNRPQCFFDNTVGSSFITIRGNNKYFTFVGDKPFQ